MPQKEMSFKGGKVFVEVDEAGELVLDDGRAIMRYKPDDMRIYNPWPNNLEPAGSKKKKAKAKPKKNDSGVKAAASGPVPEGAIVAYTDGGCIGNPGPSGLGYAIVFPDGQRVAKGEPLGEGTNNIAELTAIERVLMIVDDPDVSLVIHTDSEYAIGVLTKGWKAKANKQLIARIKKTVARFPKLELRKVRGHAGVPENELVDDLARTSAETQRTLEETDL
ncbi:MAG: reverse transcriptase-like protein [Deltaproteobacteria bacterium]|nr:reverse transcriptase-like protein [Deltaproteobacteria bacterium]